MLANGVYPQNWTAADLLLVLIAVVVGIMLMGLKAGTKRGRR